MRKVAPRLRVWTLLARWAQRRQFVFSVVFLAACGIEDEMRLPDKWGIRYQEKSVGQLIAELGEPQEFAGAKQYMNWVDQTVDGRKVLKVLCKVDCKPSEIPVEVFFLSYRNGTNRPIRAQSLLTVATHPPRHPRD